jgi:hypothetical protein
MKEWILRTATTVTDDRGDYRVPEFFPRYPRACRQPPSRHLLAKRWRKYDPGIGTGLKSALRDVL